MDEIKRIKLAWESEVHFLRHDNGATEEDRKAFDRAYGQMLEAAEMARLEINKITSAFSAKWSL